MKDIKTIMKKFLLPEYIVVIIILTIGISTLFLNPIVGMADNGDFYRIISSNGLYNLTQNNSEIMFGFFNKDYGIYRYANENPTIVITTQSLFIRLAIWFSKLFNKDYIFDIRFLSSIFLFIHSLAGYLLTKVFTYDIKNNLNKYIIVAVYVFVFCDTAYLAYFNSFHVEAVILTSFLLMIGILLYIVKFNKINIKNIIILSIVALMFFGSKQQLAPLGMFTSILLILLIRNESKKVKVATIIISIFLCMSSVFFYKSMKSDLDYINRYHAMTRGVINGKDNVEKILEEFNIDSSYSLLQGETFYEKVPSIHPNSEMLKEEFYSKYSIPSILFYYIKNPKEFIQIINVAIENAYQIRPKAMGNYELSYGKNFGEKNYSFSLWSVLKNNNLFSTLQFTMIFFVFYFYRSYKRYTYALLNKDKNTILIEEIFIYVFLAGFSQIIISVIGAGDADIAKHEFLYNVAFDLILVNIVYRYLLNREGRNIEKC